MRCEEARKDELNTKRALSWYDLRYDLAEVFVDATRTTERRARLGLPDGAGGGGSLGVQSGGEGD